MADDMNLSDKLTNEENNPDSLKIEKKEISNDTEKEQLEKKHLCEEDSSQTEKDLKSPKDPVAVLHLSCESETDDGNFLIPPSPNYPALPFLMASTPRESNGTKEDSVTENSEKKEDSFDNVENEQQNLNLEVPLNSDKLINISLEQRMSEDESISPPRKRRHIDDNLNAKNYLLDNSKDLSEQKNKNEENLNNNIESISQISEKEDQISNINNNEKCNPVSIDSGTESKNMDFQMESEQTEWCLQLSAATQPIEIEKTPSPDSKDIEAELDENSGSPKESHKKFSENSKFDQFQQLDSSKPLFQIHKPTCIQEVSTNVNSEEELPVFSCVQKLDVNISQNSEKLVAECAVTPMECDISPKTSDDNPVKSFKQNNNKLETADFVLNLSETASQNVEDTKFPEDDKELFDDEHNSDISLHASENVEKVKVPNCTDSLQINFSCKETQTDIKSVETNLEKEEKEPNNELIKEKENISAGKMLLDKTFSSEKSEFGIQVDSLCSKCNSPQNVRKLKDSRICKKIVTVVRHITTKQIIVEGKVVKTLVVEEEDDPYIEYIEGNASPVACSSHSHSPTLISHSSLTSGELTDISSFITTTKSSNSSNSSSYFTLPSHSSLNRNISGDKSTISPKSVQFQDFSTDMETSPKRKTASTYINCNEDQSKLSSSSLTNSSRSYSPEISYTEAINPNVSRSILPGLRVMAKWKDGYYYPGTICSQISDSRWTVLFDDGDSKPIWEKDLIAISLLKKGQTVYALSEDGCYDPGIIRDYYRDGKEIGYIIERDYNEFEKYPRSSVTLSNEQAASLLKSNSEIIESPSGINLDNIIEGKRRHSSRSNSSREKKQKSPRNLNYKYRNLIEKKNCSDEINSIGKNLKPSNIKQSTRSRSSDNKNDIISDFKQETPQKKKTFDCKRILSWKSSANEGSDENVKTIQKPSFPLNNQSNDQQPHHTFKSPRIQKAEKCKLSKLTGEIGKVEKKRLFVGYAFLLTSAEKKTDNKEFFSSDSYIDVSEEEIVDEYPFEKSHVQTQIEVRGGIVLESIEEIQTVKANQIFLLSNTYLRTIKFIHCLAASIPCISHLWVRDCCKTNKIQSFKTYLLPAGFNIIEKCEIEWHGKKGVLKDVRILLASSKDSFAEVWTPVLLAAQAEIVNRFPPPRNTSGSLCNIDVVLTDSSCPQNILRRANQMKIPLVSIEWIIQCLISGCKLPIDLHPKFSYDA